MPLPSLWVKAYSKLKSRKVAWALGVSAGRDPGTSVPEGSWWEANSGTGSGERWSLFPATSAGSGDAKGLAFGSWGVSLTVVPAEQVETSTAVWASAGSSVACKDGVAHDDRPSGGRPRCHLDAGGRTGDGRSWTLSSCQSAMLSAPDSLVRTRETPSLPRRFWLLWSALRQGRRLPDSNLAGKVG